MKRVSRRLTPVITLLFLLPGAQGQSQEISTSVFDSEDELVQALERGEVSYDQYLELVACVQYGVSGRELFLLNTIPNVSEQSIRDHALETDLQTDQVAPYVAGQSLIRHAQIRHRWSTELERDGRQRYRNQIRLQLDHGWSIETRVHREYSGRERLVYRTIRHESDSGAIRLLELGNFTARFGLGAVYGFRGKLVGSCRSLTTESFCFPDYGGGNGGRVELQLGTIQVEAIGSWQRDNQHSLATAAVQFDAEIDGIPEVIVGVNQLRNRGTAAGLSDVKIALHDLVRYRDGQIAYELAGQTGEQRALAALFQGRHRFEQADITFAAWAYGDRYLSLSSGGRSGALSRRVCAEPIDFEYSDRRAGQEGLTVRAVTSFTPRWQTVTALSYYGFDRTNYRFQGLPALIYRPRPGGSIRLDCQLAYRHESGETGDLPIDRRWRLEGRFQSGSWRSRVYIALENNDTTPRSLGGLVQVRAELADGSSIDGRILVSEFRAHRVRFWSGQLRILQQFSRVIELGVRFGYRYNLNSSNRRYPQVELETTIRL